MHRYPQRSPSRQEESWSTLIGDYDTRPGNYYIVAHPEGKRPHEGCYFIAGPYFSHREADRLLRTVRDVAEWLEPVKAMGMDWITARTELDDIRKTSLGPYNAL